MSFNNRQFYLIDKEHYLLKKEHRINNPLEGSCLGKIFLLEIEITPEKFKAFYDGETDDAVLNRISLKPFKKRRV